MLGRSQETTPSKGKEDNASKKAVRWITPHRAEHLTGQKLSSATCETILDIGAKEDNASKKVCSRSDIGMRLPRGRLDNLSSARRARRYLT